MYLSGRLGLIVVGLWVVVVEVVDVVVVVGVVVVVDGVVVVVDVDVVGFGVVASVVVVRDVGAVVTTGDDDGYLFETVTDGSVDFVANEDTDVTPSGLLVDAEDV